MNTSLSRLAGVLLLSVIGLTNAVADNRNQDDERDRARTIRQAESRRNYEASQQSINRPSPQAEPQRQQTENGRRNNRLSPEEKQALRRQINEAGHDIYQPNR